MWKRRQKDYNAWSMMKSTLKSSSTSCQINEIRAVVVTCKRPAQNSIMTATVGTELTLKAKVVGN